MSTEDQKDDVKPNIVGGVDMNQFKFQPKEPAEETKDANSADDAEFDPTTLSEFEQTQYKKGWRPEDVWAAEGHDPSEWRNAKQFAERGELLNTISKLRRGQKKTDAQLAAMQKWNEEVEENAFKRLQTSLKDQLKAARKEGNNEEIANIEEQLEAVDKAHEEKTTKRKEVLGESGEEAAIKATIEAWKEEREWVGNPFLWGEAVRIVQKAEIDGKSFEEALELADEHVNGLLSNMGQPARKAATVEDDEDEKPRKPAARVIGGNRPTNRSTSTTNRVPPKSALPEDAQDVYNKMVKSARNPGGFMTHDTFMKQYIAKGGRLVGQG